MLTNNKETMHALYSPAKVESELHGQNKSHLVISIQTYQQQSNKATVYYSPSKVKSAQDCMSRIEIIWLFQSKQTS